MVEKKARKKHIKYSEGQWFAVPLKDGGYALGIIVRGSYKTRGGLGYFFGPRYERVPDEAETWNKRPEDAIYITWFGDLGIIWGRWPLIPSTRPFRREEWPVPKFHRIDSLNPNKGWLVEYRQDDDGRGLPERETYVDIKDIAHLPRDATAGAGAVEITLTKILSEQEGSSKGTLRE